MMTRSILALLALVLLAAASPVEARYYGDGYGVRHHYRHHHRWHGHWHARAVSDYYHHSRQLVGTR